MSRSSIYGQTLEDSSRPLSTWQNELARVYHLEILFGHVDKYWDLCEIAGSKMKEDTLVLPLLRWIVFGRLWWCNWQCVSLHARWVLMLACSDYMSKGRYHGSQILVQGSWRPCIALEARHVLLIWILFLFRRIGRKRPLAIPTIHL